jgi:hypothetical protein
MTVSSKLRDAEGQGAERLKTGIQDVSARARKLHLRRDDKPDSTHPDPEQGREGGSKSDERTGIVSVNGRDVGKMRCTGGQRYA